MEELINLLRDIASAFESRLRNMEALQELKLAPFQARLLALIARHPKCSQQNLASWVDRDKAQIARTIKELEARGLLERTQHASDWRSYSLSLTPDGESVWAILMRERARLSAEMGTPLTPDERQVVIDTLRKMDLH